MDLSSSLVNIFIFRGQYLFKNKPPDENAPPNSFYRALYPKIIQDIEVRICISGYFLSVRGSLICLTYKYYYRNPIKVFSGG